MTLMICFLQLTTVQGLRALSMLGLSAAGFTYMMVARGRAGKTSKQWQLIIGLLVAVSIMVLAFVIRNDSERCAIPHRHVRWHDDRRDRASQPTRCSSSSWRSERLPMLTPTGWASGCS